MNNFRSVASSLLEDTVSNERELELGRVISASSLVQPYRSAGMGLYLYKSEDDLDPRYFKYSIKGHISGVLCKGIVFIDDSNLLKDLEEEGEVYKFSESIYYGYKAPRGSEDDCCKYVSGLMDIMICGGYHLTPDELKKVLLSFKQDVDINTPCGTYIVKCPEDFCEVDRLWSSREMELELKSSESGFGYFCDRFPKLLKETLSLSEASNLFENQCKEEIVGWQMPYLF